MTGLSTISVMTTLALLFALAGQLTYGQTSRPQTQSSRAANAKHDKSQLQLQRHRQGPGNPSTRSRRVKRAQAEDSSSSRNVLRKQSANVQTAAFQDWNVEVPESQGHLANEHIVSNHCSRCCLDSCVACTSSNMERLTWFRAEYLYWWTNGMETPALATTSPAGTPQQDAGRLGAAGTTVLFGANELVDGGRSGGRFSLGMQLDPCQSQVLELAYTALGEETNRFSGSSSDFAILARPFVNAQTGSPDARLISFPSQLDGTLSIEASSEFQTAEVLIRRTTRRECGWHMDVLWGYRFADLDDAVRVNDSTSALSGPIAGASLGIFDEFASENQFHGGEIGIHYMGARRGCWSLDLLAKVALGNSRFRGTVAGVTTSTDAAGNSSTTPVGLLALDSNIGTYKEDTFSTMAEFGVTLRRHLPCGVTATFGYTLLGWSDVLRAGEQIDATLNLSQIPPGTLAGASRPRFPFDTTSFWAQGLSLGLEYSF